MHDYSPTAQSTCQNSSPALLVRYLIEAKRYFPYHTVWQAMRDFTQTRTSSTTDEIWLLEHQPVYTLGRAALAQHVLSNPHSIPLIRSDRGGQVTYHGPGQWMIYTLLDLKRLQLGIRSLVSSLQNILLQLSADFGIHATLRAKAPGVYVDSRKLCAIGLRVSRGCCYHGLACNMELDLTPFEMINPCGYAGLEATHWQAEYARVQPAESLNSAWQEQWLQQLMHHLQVMLHYRSVELVRQLPAALSACEYSVQLADLK